jgi:phosphotriesterase-related protein
MTSPVVMTVNGPISQEDLGTVLPHEHVLIDLTRQVIVGGLLSDVDLMIQELQEFVAAGGTTIVDCTSDAIGRDPAALEAISRRTGLNIVMGCGAYREPFLDNAHIDRSSVQSLADELVFEITHGVGASGIRPGIIGEIGSERFITSCEERVLRAAGRAHLQTGLAITTHSARWPNGLRQLSILGEEGVDARNVVIGHADTIPQSDYHIALCEAGCFVQFDTIRMESDYEVARRVRHVVSVLAAGYGDQLLLSHDVWSPYHLRVSGGGGYTFLMTEFRERLAGAGVSDDDFDRITVANPARALVGAAGTP